MGCAGLPWDGLGWVGLAWAGLGWVGGWRMLFCKSGFCCARLKCHINKTI